MHMPHEPTPEESLGQGPSHREPIRLLDPHTVNQIAAGEVVERPAAVVKELVENALDAGARAVTVLLEDFGRSLVSVEDDGHGMSRASLEAALGRHATSKIRSVSDLGRVATYGFRGEALPSIASVSRWAIESAEPGTARWRVEGEAGETQSAGPAAGPAGTKVEVADLFFNTPARLKFLKSDATELNNAVEAVARLAIARPEVRFRVAHGGAEVLFAPGTGSVEDAAAGTAGQDAARGLVPVDGYNGSARVIGLVSPPHFTKPTRSLQWFSVNGRPVRSRLLTAALDTAYRSLTPERRYPLVLLDVRLDPSTVDVNVSPTKSEVKFQNERGVFDAVRRAVSEALLAQGMVPRVEAVELADRALASARSLPGSEAWHLPAPTPTGPGALRAAVYAQAPLEEGAHPLPAHEPDPSLPEFLHGLRVIGQMEDTFILAENWQGLLLIDQHVAHERILYERLLETRGSGAVETQKLLEPETLHLEKRAAGLFLERLDDLRAIGFEIEPFGGESFLVRAVPALWRGARPMELLQDIADAVEEGDKGPLRQARDDVFILASCKMAIKANDRLAYAEMVQLLSDLGRTTNPYLCPHGRPITIVMPKAGIYRRFHRNPEPVSPPVAES
ncbi:MAG: DNA mismatch repair endonuclease MutL [Fimbriimonadaceae bacterium]|nr:DNA mismatch repair endonuclease MutL [Fimbriimonadaceae bacterium]